MHCPLRETRLQSPFLGAGVCGTFYSRTYLCYCESCFVPSCFSWVRFLSFALFSFFLFFSILFFLFRYFLSILFYYILIYSILIYSILFGSILFSVYHLPPSSSRPLLVLSLLFPFPPFVLFALAPIPALAITLFCPLFFSLSAVRARIHYRPCRYSLLFLSPSLTLLQLESISHGPSCHRRHIAASRIYENVAMC